MSKIKKKTDKRDTALAIVKALVAMSASLTVDCHTCSYWKYQVPHDPQCLTVRARKFLRGAK